MPYYIPNPHFHDDPLQVFEQGYHAHNNVSGFWGPVQSSIDWCERNYVVSHYVAEWYNTFSNLCMVYLALVGVTHALASRHEFRIVLLNLTCLTVGLGSIVFHGTLSHLGQQGDETPMIWTVMTWGFCVYAIDPKFERAHTTRMKWLVRFLVTFCAIFTVAHYYLRLVVAFQVFFGTLTISKAYLIVAEMLRCTNRSARLLGFTYCVGMVVAFGFWLVDVHGCEHMHDLPLGIPNPQFHAWWHALTGISCYCGPAFLSFRRLELLGADPVVTWRAGVPVAVARVAVPGKRIKTA
jgi:dihydroceramidase